MTCDELIQALYAHASERYKANVVKMGIPCECSIGTPMAEIRRLAKEQKKSNALALALWRTGYHEARLLAVLLFEKKELPAETAERLIQDVASWDLCDHLCKSLLVKQPDCDVWIKRWIDSPHTYKKRAAFTLMAAGAIHKSCLSEETLEGYLRLIQEHSQDEREPVKKAASWALREIGKRDFSCQEKALALAYELRARNNKPQAWIARDALKELENLVKVEGRTRLISANSAMGKSGGGVNV